LLFHLIIILCGIGKDMPPGMIRGLL